MAAAVPAGIIGTSQRKPHKCICVSPGVILTNLWMLARRIIVRVVRYMMTDEFKCVLLTATRAPRLTPPGAKATVGNGHMSCDQA